MNRHIRLVEDAPPGPRRKQIRGDDEFTTIGGQTFLHWDLWFAIVLVQRFDASFDSLREALHEDDLSQPSWRRHAHRAGIEQRLSHFDDLRERLEVAGTGVRQLVASADVTPYLENKARVKVLGDKHGLSEALDPTPAMIHTPRARLSDRARRGNWASFPVSPEPFDQTFRNCGRSKDGYSKNASFKVARRLGERLARQAERAHRNGVAEEVACYRGFLAGFLDVMDRTDDSFGVMGELYIHDAAPVYLKLDWRSTGLDPEAWYRDFVEYAVWEDYGLLDSGRLDGKNAVDRFCRSVPTADFELVDGTICAVVDELAGEFDLDYRVADARQLRASLVVAKRRFDRFAEVASDLGSDWWMPIELMAQAAIKGRRRDVAALVFDAADVPGMQRDYILNMRQRLLSDGGS